MIHPKDDCIPERFYDTLARIDYLDYLVRLWRHSRPSVLEPWHIVTHLDKESNVVHVRRDTGEEGVLNDPQEVRVVMRWMDSQNRVERALLDHPSIQVVRDEVTGTLLSVTIIKDFLEKDQVRWWSVRDLEQVVSMQRIKKGPVERFRPFFIPVLKTVLEELQSQPPEEGDFSELKLDPSPPGELGAGPPLTVP